MIIIYNKIKLIHSKFKVNKESFLLSHCLTIYSIFLENCVDLSNIVYLKINNPIYVIFERIQKIKIYTEISVYKIYSLNEKS